jgi:Protein of unknown function (DUF3102)
MAFELLEKMGSGTLSEFLPRTEVEAVVKRHRELWERIKVSLEEAIELGEIIRHWQSDVVPDGQWLAWLTENVPFTHQMADFYIRLWENREFVRKETEKLLELPSMRFLEGLVKKKTKTKSRKTKLQEYCPTCGRVLTKAAKAWMKQHSGKH